MKQAQLYDDSLSFEENKASGPFGGFADNSKPYQNLGEPKYDFFGVPVYSPFGIGAGPLPTAKYIQAVFGKGFDIATFKAVRTEAHPINPYPHVRPLKLSGDLHPGTEPVEVADSYKEPLAVANSLGVPSLAPNEWQPDMRKALQTPKKGQAVLVTLQGTARTEDPEDFVQDHVKGVDLIKQTGARIIELNLSCPNVIGHATLTCFDTPMTTRIVDAVRAAHPDIKLLIKLAYFTDKDALRDLIKHVGNKVDGITVINTIPAAIVNADGTDVFPKRHTAGVSGAPIKWAGLEMTRTLDALRTELDLDYNIVGMGGVLNADDFDEYMQAGADIVLSVTGAMWNPGLAAEIKLTL